MLVLERGVHETFTVSTPAGDYAVTVVGIRGGQVRLGIVAPKEWPISREDIKDSKPKSATAGQTTPDRR